MREVSVEDQSRKLFLRGIDKLKGGDTLTALSCIERAYNLSPDIEISSYLGLLTALERGLISEGMALCRKALEQEPDNPVFLFNLGRVYYKAGLKREAIKTVRKSILFGGGSDPIDWLNDRGIRKQPVFKFLPRSHPLNKYTGLALSRLGLR